MNVSPLRLRVRGLYLTAALSALFFLWLQFRSSLRSTARDPTYGLLNATSSTSKYAIATFLTGSSTKDTTTGNQEAEDDYYYIAARVLTYQILHAPETRSRSPIPFLVLVTPTVSHRKRKQLTSDGATVVPVEDVPLRWWIKTGVTRWKDVFGKLRLFEMVEYDRIIFLDADSLITEPVDGIFDEPIVRTPSNTLLDRTDHIKGDESLLPAQYMFAARSDNALSGERDHPFPPVATEVFSAGFWVMAPSREMFAYFLSVMSHYRRFDPHTMEQSLMNYAYRRDGAMPWAELSYKWSATWPNDKDLEGKVVALHEKLWKTGPKDLTYLWWSYKDKMDRFHADMTASNT